MYSVASGSQNMCLTACIDWRYQNHPSPMMVVNATGLPNLWSTIFPGLHRFNATRTDTLVRPFALADQCGLMSTRGLTSPHTKQFCFIFWRSFKFA